MKTKSQNVVARAAALHEELVGELQGGWVSPLAPEDFVLQGNRDPVDGKLSVQVKGHRALTDPQWKSWVTGALLRAGALADIAQKVWDAGVTLVDFTSHGSVGRAMKPYAFGMILFLDDLWLQVENLQLHPDLVVDFQKRVADRTFTAMDLLQMIRVVEPVAGKGAAQTGGDQIYRKDNIVGYGTM